MRRTVSLEKESALFAKHHQVRIKINVIEWHQVDITGVTLIVPMSSTRGRSHHQATTEMIFISSCKIFEQHLEGPIACNKERPRMRLSVVT